MARGHPASGQRTFDPVRQSHAYAWFRRHEAGRGVAAHRGARRSRDPGALRLLPPLARRRCPDLGRARDDAPRRRRLPAGRAPDHAAHDRVPELSERGRHALARPGSAQAVEAEGAAGEHLVLRLGRQRPEALPQHLRRAREEAVLVRIIGGPHDLVRPDIAGQHRDAALDRLERDPAIALEQLARPRLRRGLVEALVIEVPVHAVEPRRDPAAARFEKRDAQSRMTVNDTAPDHAQGDQHHLHRVRDHVAGRAVVLEPVDADGRHRGGRSLVKADREVELLGHLPERLVHRIADHLLAVIRIGPQESAAHPELFACVAHLVDRQIDRLHRQHGDPEEALGIWLAVVGEPAVVGAAHPGGKAGILDGAREQAETGIEEGGVDAVGIHVDDARVRVEPALAPFGVFQGVGLDDSLSDADGTQTADPPRIAQQLTFDAQALLAVVVDDKPRPALAEFGIDVLVPQVERLEDVTVGVDYVVRARHGQSLRRRSNSHILPQPRYPAHGSERAHVTRIASVKPHPISVPLNDPVWTAHEELTSSSVIVVEVRTDDGLTGYGQIHGSPMKAICAWVERFGEIVRGMDALAHVAVWDRLFSLTCPRPGGIAGADGLPPPLPRGERPQIMAAIGGIDIALWDIKGKHAGLPVWRVLGGERRPIPTYATGGYYRPGAPDTVYAEELAGFVKAGYRAVKLKTGAGSPADEARRVRTVREAIGKGVSLMLDMNAPYDVDGCIEFARRVEPLDIYWLEEPLHWYLQPADFVRLAAATSIPLAHGERELTRFTVRDFIATGAIRYVQFDSTRAAGFTEGLRVAALAEQHAVMIAPHTAPELHAHLVAALPRCGFGVESHGDAARNPLSHHLLLGGPETRDSFVHLNDKPGFGVEIDWDYAKRYAA